MNSPDATRTVDWDASTYDRLADNQEDWAGEVLGRFGLRGDETVLDAGCGSGRTTALLLKGVPRGRVIGVDGSRSMIEHARKALESEERVDLRVGDLLELALEVEVDAVFSNATFHWILDHETLFQRLHAVMRAGGQLEAQCGGEGNVAEWTRVLEAVSGDARFSPYLGGLPSAWNFASVADTEERLEQAGFEVGRVWLEPRPVVPREPREYVRAVGLAKHLAALPADLHEAFVDAVMGSMPRPLRLEYVRLNISAGKPS